MHWDTDKKADLNESIMGSAVIFGMTVGAVSGGALM